jgi:2-aminoethylphosphonate-pyruvate transaminase
MQKTTQWRFTPPTHVVAAFRCALDQFKAEGGTRRAGRAIARTATP